MTIDSLSMILTVILKFKKSPPKTTEITNLSLNLSLVNAFTSNMLLDYDRDDLFVTS